MADYYFNLIKEDIENLKISETKNKDNCFIHHKNNRGSLGKGFILDENSRSKIICDVSFHKHKDTNKYIPRLIFKKINKEYKVQEKEKIIIAFNKSEKAFYFWKLINFLKKFKDLVDNEDFENSYNVVKKDFITKIKQKSRDEKNLEISKIIKELNIPLEDISEYLIFKEREENLKIFEGLLNNAIKNDGITFFEWYRKEYNITQPGKESIWHHFLKNNKWIIGLNLDIKFIKDFLSEQKVGIENSEGRNSPKVDLLGEISNFTILIELKRADTKIFTSPKKGTSRANTWSFTSDFIDGISQCLGQKFSLEKSYESKDFLNNGKLLDKRKIRTLDPKSIFIIGNRKEEFPLDNSSENIIKNETFERFRRNNKHIEIITFDELYERAKYIIK